MLLDIALAAVVGVLLWQVRGEWVEAHARRQALLGVRIKPVAAAPLAPLPKIAPLAAVAYAEIAQMNLFSKDRNPQVILDEVKPPPPKPVPPFPVAEGVLLWEGTPPMVLLSARSGAPQRGYRAGDVIGEWKIVSVDNQYVVFEWDGKEFKKRLDELMDKAPLVASEAPQMKATPNVQVVKNPSLSDSKKSGPGIDVGGDIRDCTPGDTTPAGTVQDGYKKIVTATPFGNSCRWEPVK